jgi:hypothetical protein
LSAAAAPATVTWWEGEQDHVTAWLTVRAGSPPLEQEAWLAQLAVTAPDPGGWAVVSAVPLGGMHQELSARLRDPIGAGRPGLSSVAFSAAGEPLAGEASAELYDQCRAAALALVAERMGEAIVAREPGRSGLMLLRLDRGTDGLVLDLAPAIDEPAWRGRPIDLDLGTDVQDPTFGSETVIVAGEAVTLPCAHLPLERGAGSVRIALPKLHLPGTPAPLVHLTFAAN